MNWFKTNVINFFNNSLKEICALTVGLVFMLFAFRFNVPTWDNVFIFIVLLLLSSVIRYNFVAQEILIKDMKKLSEEKKIISYILSKNIFSFLLTLVILAITCIILFIFNNSLVSYNLLINIFILSIFIISFENIIFMFRNKPVELRDNNFSAIKNIELGYKDLIDSIPSIISTIIVTLFNVYIVSPNIYQAFVTLIMSVILLNLKLNNSITK